MAFLLFFTAVILSGIAAYYSVIGLIAIFSAAVWPVAIMGGSLEAAKLVVASWLYRYWRLIPVLMKVYFTSALLILMLITSMGIFGFLSKAHSDQSLVSGDVVAKIAVYDEKIKIAKDNIDANRKALKQMDEAVDQVMGRSTDEKGADKAVSIRRGQAKERARLLAEIQTEQKTITKLNEERAPIAAEVRKVEAEVGPLKYIAALIYGDNPDENMLERSVRWLIILLIAVFDPLAVLMLIAANLTQLKQKEWIRQNSDPVKEEVNDTKDKVVSDQTIMQVADSTTEQPEPQEDNGTEVKSDSDESATVETVGVDPAPVGWMYTPVGVPTDQEIPKKKTRKNKRTSKEDNTPASDIASVIEQPVETVNEDKSIEQGLIGKPVTVDDQVQTMIDKGDQQGLEQIYKKIVKELAKKNRSKSTHWGPIKNKNG
jgi:hypothetical protein